MTRHARRMAPRTRRRAVIGGVVGVGAAAFVSEVALAYSEPAPNTWRVALVVALVALGESLVLHLRFGNDRYTVTWAEATAIIGIVLVPWPWVPVTAAVGVTLALALARRDPVKIAFNASSAALSTTLAAGTAYLAAGTTRIADVPMITAGLALIAAAVVYFVSNSVTVAAVIASVRELPFRQVMLEGVLLKIAVLAGDTIVALLLLSVPWHGAVLVLVPFCITAVFLAYRGYHQAIEEGAVWKRLDDAAKELRVLDGAGVARAAVHRAVELFDAEFAELTTTTAGDEAETARAGNLDNIDPVTFEGWVVDTPLTIATGRGSSGGETIGSLRLGFLGSPPLAERKRRVLRTYAHTVATSLQNARLYAEMQHQAAVNAYEATRDPLTSIPNRKRLSTELREALARAENSGRQVSLLLLDLDHFKEINDTLGHHAGDAVLCAVADTLTAMVRPEDVVARLGGDEFAILLGEVKDGEDADAAAQRVLTALNEPVPYEGLHLAVGASIGISCYPSDGSTAEDLLRCADMALYQAKQARGTVARYRSDLDDHSISKITLAAELRTAIDDEQFVLMFQPQVDLATEELVGAEALTRWQHPTRGLLGPIEFIDMVERSGLIRQFTLHVIERAVREAAAWRARGVTVPVSVNLSARNLLDADLPGAVAVILARHGLRGDQLILEITETTMVSDVETVETILTGLRYVGVQLSIDDFGTGYSSLAFLQRNAVNEIKIDKSFVIAMMQSDSDAAIVRATIELAHGLGVRVMAEGVETAGHRDALRALGCDGAQGWYYGRPAPAAQLGVDTGDRVVSADASRPARSGRSAFLVGAHTSARPAEAGRRLASTIPPAGPVREVS